MHHVETCPTCGAVITQPIQPPPFGLSLTEHRIYNYIATHPECSMLHIAIAIYGREITESNVVSVHISHIKKKLQGESVRLLVSNRGPLATYRIIKLEDPQPHVAPNIHRILP